MTNWARHFIGWTEWLRRRGARGPIVMSDFVTVLGFHPVAVKLLVPTPAHNDNECLDAWNAAAALAARPDNCERV